MQRSWRLKEIDEAARLRLEQDLNVHPALARCLVGRGITDGTTAGAFLRPRLCDLRSPHAIADFDRALQRLEVAVRESQPIGIFGDYDVDGITTTALLTLFLRSIGATCEPRVARRDVGYGFGEGDASWFAERGCRVIVICDCGTSDIPAIAAAQTLGIDVVVLDHHRVPGDLDHPALALINPHRPDSAYPFRGLASVGLGFLLAAGLRTVLREGGWFLNRPEPDVRDLLDLVAVGTISDMAPLREENRILVTCGLKILAQRKRPGFLALLERAEIDPTRPLDETDVAWRLGPRLNAPGRLGEARPALDLLLASDRSEAAHLAAVCDEANARRRDLTEKTVLEALDDAADQADAACVVVGRPGWNPGVVGIVAAKLVERFRRPAAVVALDPATGEGRGSVRTFGTVDVYQALERCRDQLIRYGGHAQAAGLTVLGHRLAEFRESFALACGAAPTPHIAETADLELDAELDLGSIDEQLALGFQALAPFGPGNEPPVVAVLGARVRSSRRVGDGSHLKLLLECNRTRAARSAIAFRLGDRDPGAGATVDVAFCPEVSEWRGERRVELKVRDLRRTDASGST